MILSSIPDFYEIMFWRQDSSCMQEQLANQLSHTATTAPFTFRSIELKSYMHEELDVLWY